MWSRTLLLILALALLPSAVSAQQIQGRLIEDGTGLPITAGAVMLLDEAGEAVIARAISDSLGVFLLEASRPGTYRQRAERVGYQGSTTEPFETVPRQILRVELRLSTAAILLEPLEVVSASRPSYAWGKLAQFYDNKEYYHDKLGLGRIFTREDIQKHQPSRVSDLMRRIAGVRVVPHPSRPGHSVVRTGRKNCEGGFRGSPALLVKRA